MKFSIKKNEDSGGTSSNRKPLRSPDSTVASSGSKFSFMSPFNDSKVNKSAALGRGNINATPVASKKRILAESLAQQSKGNAFLQEADATLKKSTLPGSSTTKKNERAVESLKNAAEAYKAGGGMTRRGRHISVLPICIRTNLRTNLRQVNAWRTLGSVWRNLTPQCPQAAFGWPLFY